MCSEVLQFLGEQRRRKFAKCSVPGTTSQRAEGLVAGGAGRDLIVGLDGVVVSGGGGDAGGELLEERHGGARGARVCFVVDAR